MLRQLLKRASKTGLGNVALLVAGYGFGQGSIFLAQTWLLARGELDLLALFGTHFAFAMFGILVVDGGALVTLARHAASLNRGEETASITWKTFWETTCFRLALALATIAAGAGVLLVASQPFTIAYTVFAAPAFLVWAINAAGLLDGFRLSGISGVTGSLSYASSALTLLFVEDMEPATAGALLGAAFSAGYVLTVLIQFIALHKIGVRARLERPRLHGVASAARDGLLVLGGTLPGQAYFRLQLVVSSAWLGAPATAVFVYVKQVVTAATQLIGFIRRVEFPKLVRTMGQPGVDPLSTSWRLQLKGTAAGMLVTLLMICLAPIFVLTRDPVLARLGPYLAAFGLSVAASSVFLALSQGLSAIGRYGAVCIRAVAAATIGTLLSLALVRPFGLYGFAAADLAAAVTSCLIATHALRQRREPSLALNRS